LGAVFCLIASYALYGFKTAREGISKESDLGYSRGPISLAFLFWGLTAIGIQSVTLKTQQEANQWGFVYIFYSTLMISLIVIIYIFRSFLFDGTIAYFIVSLIIVINIFVNVNSSSILFKEYSTNHRMTNAMFNTKTTNEYRCRIKYEWVNSRKWPKYYVDDAVKSFDEYSVRIRGKEFCDTDLLKKPR
jgi:hypothetical protein